MTPARFGGQALVVLALVALVSWPEQRQLRAGVFWHAGRLAPDPSAADSERTGSAARRRYHIGYGSASEARLGAGAAWALHRKLHEQDVEGRRRRMPPAVSVLGGKLNAIVGAARTFLDAPIAFARLALRNLTTGVVEARATGDEHGRFAFVDVTPGTYIVELLDADGNVIAASGPVAIGVNDVRETVVRQSGRQSGRQVLASFGGALTPTAQEAVEAAADEGVNRVSAPERCASPPCIGAAPRQ